MPAQATPANTEEQTPEILSVKGLSIERGGTHILTAVDWAVRGGEQWVILGSNGSGKTSLLSALTGYISPTAGSIFLLGEEYGATDWRDLRRKIGIVSSTVRQMMHDSEPALNSVVSGKYAMIEQWGRITEADRAAAREILRQTETEYLAERPWLVLSQGERQRVLIGRALMARPRVLILDEPCAGLDPVAREQFLSFIQRLASAPDAPALLLVTHHVEEIMPVFTHALLLRSGRVAASGPKRLCLTSTKLSEIFGARCRVGRLKERYTLRIDRSSASVL